MKTSVLLILSSFALVVSAEERGQSIMFQDKPNEYEYLTTEPKPQGQNPGDHCMELSRQIEQLKGKPQRRHALMQQYQVECQEPDISPTPDFQ
jgi:hypothetical protein